MDAELGLSHRRYTSALLDEPPQSNALQTASPFCAAFNYSSLHAGSMNIENVDVDVPGGRVFVRKWMPETATISSPIILLHDSLGSVGLWRDFPDALARCGRRPVIGYDRLGFGRSTARREPPSVDFIREEAEVFFPSIRSALGITDFS